jgi:pimeloyl-ACP methyl ester carboxylesterase
MTIEELIYTKDYPLEIHNVTTSDGYVLRVYRIPGAKFEDDYKTKVKQPVLFQHGLLDSSDGWVCNSEDLCLPYILANAGYDIWLTNSRGNKHSKSHLWHNPVSFEYWSFTFHEMGLYDLPAVLDHIYITNLRKEKIIYIGHSQGTCMLFAALTQKLEYFKERIKLFIALAPVARVGGMTSTLLKAMQSFKFHKLLKAAKLYEVFPPNETSNTFNSWLNKNFSSLTNLVIDMISDRNSKVCNNTERLGVYMTHYPAGTSLKAINHFIQNFNCKKFCQYDYKKEANIFIYKQITPLEYDMRVIRDIPICLIAGVEDKLASIIDVRWLRDELGENVIYYQEMENVGHITFLMGKDAYWFKEVFEIILKYTNSECVQERKEFSVKLYN